MCHGMLKDHAIPTYPPGMGFHQPCWGFSNFYGISAPLDWPKSGHWGTRSGEHCQTMSAPQSRPRRGHGSQHFQGTGHPRIPTRNGVPPTLERFLYLCLGYCGWVESTTQTLSMCPQMFPRRGTWSFQPWTGDLGCGSWHHQGMGHPHIPTRGGVPPTLMRLLYLWLSQKVDAGTKLPNYGGLEPHPSGVTTQEHHLKCHPMGAL